ncbi:F-box only protein 42 [Tribolium castaneum]|uniref:F-box only protein 42-like Protein n=1 Tax=Tribolium castaneum TaxID=7070 RepID=A0A139WID7_TRICA|nr:PREDICTED: F-box only protein 42 [Tribolium castaneum]KYB27517.1 F-box only protein 42-like Protein [Tribolium castaneum]|eukprot:XP_969806.1 PREDICTED: F-box only protein 42 [Tribolium castaneum]
MSVVKSPAQIEDLPDEVLEFILSLIPPYKDLHDCMQVSKRWRRCVLNVAKTKLRNLHKAIVDFDIRWFTLTPVEMAPTISKRYSHTAAIHENSMYVFGGCTCSMTTFNDLWRLDLSKRQWVRPLAMGTYPSPKACSSLICYKDLLVLFGGWAYPPSYPLYQSWHLFNELHIYDIAANHWTCVNTTNTPPPTAGHSVSVVGEWMIVFGGIHKPSTAVHCEKSNDIWKLNLETWTWYRQEVEGEPRPNGRLGQTQVVLDPKHLLIIGGSGGPTLNYCDAWILNMEGAVWKWKQVDIEGKANKPNNIWTNPGCKIGDKIVMLNRIREDQTCPIVYYPKNSWVNRRSPQEDSKLARIDLASREPDRDENVNGRRGVLRNQKREADDDDVYQPGCSNNQRGDILINNWSPPINNLAAFSVPNNRLSKSDRIREQRLARLSEIKENMKKNKKEEKNKSHYLGIYVLDLSKALSSRPYVTWLPPKNLGNGPEETILYTLLAGKSELVMFGGIRKDPTSLGFSVNFNSQISNSLHFISAPNYVI